MDYQNMNTQHPVVIENKTGDVIILVDIPKIDEMFAWLREIDLQSGQYHIKLSPHCRFYTLNSKVSNKGTDLAGMSYIKFENIKGRGNIPAYQISRF